MPNIYITLPDNSLDSEGKKHLIRSINEAAAIVEEIPPNPRQRAMCWITVNETPASHITCGGHDMTSQALPCMVMIYLPAGVLNPAKRSMYVNLVNQAFKQAYGVNEKRMLMTSVVLHEVPDGQWGVNGDIWMLKDFAKLAGYTHLQHLVNQ
jgi:phenylpyruvate tautomerase PptA (4-oxalocrotonate tautomerase family)